MHLKVGIVGAMLRMRGLKPPDTHQEVWGTSDSGPHVHSVKAIKTRPREYVLQSFKIAAHVGRMVEELY